MEYKYLRIDKEARKAYLLGYCMPLTESELMILSALLEKTLCSSEGMSTQEILRSYTVKSIQPSNITVHIWAINKKAKAIGGRRLVVFTDGCYCLNEYM